MNVDQKMELFDIMREKGRELKDITILMDFPSFSMTEFNTLSGLGFGGSMESLGSPEQKNQLTLLATLFGNPGPADWKQANTNCLALKDTISRVNENSETQHSDNDMRLISLVVNRNNNDLVNLKGQLLGLKMFVDICNLHACRFAIKPD
jgi:hypothetical protein